MNRLRLFLLGVLIFSSISSIQAEISGTAIFSNGFETNNPATWGWTLYDGACSAVGGAAALQGSYSMQVTITDTTGKYIQDSTPNHARYRARFLFDPNSLAMAAGNQFTLFRGIYAASGDAFRIKLRYSSGQYQIGAQAWDDNNATQSSAWFTISDASHTLEIEQAASSANGANDGAVILWIDREAKAILRGMDLDTKLIGTAILGTSEVGDIDAGTSGSILFDAFESAEPPARTAPVLAEMTVQLETDTAQDNIAGPGDTLTYKTSIINRSALNANNLNLIDTLDGNTSLVPGSVKTTPLAFEDAYTVIGNVGLNVPAANGLLANDVDLENKLKTGPPALNTGLTVVSPPSTTTGGGSLAVSADGGFTYMPPAGYEGTDSFTYTIFDADGNQDSSTVTLTVNEVVWFVNADAGSNGDGRLGTPFNSLANFNTGASDDTGDIVFLYSAAASYSGGLTLLNTQQLIGQGVALAAAAGLTAPAYSNPLPGASSKPTVTNAGGDGITLAQNNTLKGLTVGTTTGWGIVGSNVGTLTTDTVDINGSGGVLSITTGALAMSLGSISKTACPAQGIYLSGVSGSLTTGSTSISEPIGTGIQVAGGTTAALDFGTTTINDTAGVSTGIELASTNPSASITFDSLSLTTQGTGLLVTNSGAVILNGGSNTVASTGGPALRITGSTLSGSGWAFSSLSSSGSSTYGLCLTDVTGTISSAGGSITNSAGGSTGIYISGGNGAFSYAGTVSTTTGRAVQIGTRTGGAITLSGNINATSGTGILLQNNTGGTVTFSGTVNLSTGANDALALSSNSGGTYTFSNTLTLAATSGRGLYAANTGLGSTLAITGSANTVSTTGIGTPVTITNTTIGAGHVLFRSVSANGSPNAVVLNNTGSSGRFEVTGTGAANSGGNVLNISGSAFSLTSTNSPTLRYVNISSTGSHAVTGSGVTNLTVANCTINLAGNADNEHAVYFSGNPGLQGTLSISDTTLSAFFETGVRIENQSQNLTATVTNCSFSNNDDSFGQDAVLMIPTGSAKIDLSLTGSTFDNIEQNFVHYQSNSTATNDVTVSGNTSTNGGGPDDFPSGGGMTLVVSANGSLTFDALNNNIRNAVGEGILVVGKGTASGSITGNHINTSLGNGVKIDYDEEAGSHTWTLLVQNNIIGTEGGYTGIGDNGINVLHRDSNGTLNCTLENNSIGNTAYYGIRYFTAERLVPVQNRAAQNKVKISSNQFTSVSTVNLYEEISIATDDLAQACLTITGNSITSDNGSPSDIYLDQRVAGKMSVTQTGAANITAVNNSMTVDASGVTLYSSGCGIPPLP